MSNISQRLKAIRNAKNLTQASFGEILGVSKQAIANIETSHNNPSIELIGKLIENLNVNSNWLIAGKGSMFNESSSAQVRETILSEVEKMLTQRGL